MSIKTLRALNRSPMSSTRERSALQKLPIASAIAVLCIAPTPSFPLELGEAAIRSSLGHPLRVEIPYRLAANERLSPTCVGLAPPRRDSALPEYSRASSRRRTSRSSAPAECWSH
jgi:hypothetical protein